MTMLLALVAKATVRWTESRAERRLPIGGGSDAGLSTAARSSRSAPCGRSGGAWRWPSLASVATAVALNVLVISAPGAAREILEGVVMLVGRRACSSTSATG